MTNKEAINNLNFIMDYYKDLDDYTINQLRNLTLSLSSDEIEALDKAIKSLEAWDKVKKEMLSQSIIKTHTESYESGFSDGLERAFDIMQDIIEEYLEGE